MQIDTAKFLTATVLTLCCMLVACGGSGGGSSGSAAPPVSPGAPIVFKGFAATGAALVNAQVQAKCVGGTSANAITSDLGAYEVTIAAPARLPCMVQVVGGPLGRQHAVVDINYVSAPVNVTPLSDLVLSTAVGGSAANLFNSFSESSVESVSPAKLAQAHKEVVAALRPLVNFSSVLNFVHEPLVPLVAGKQVGNALDKQIDELNAKLLSFKATYPMVSASILSVGTGEAAAKALWGTDGAQGPVATDPKVPALTAQSIGFFDIPNQTMGGVAPTLVAAAFPSGLTVVLTSSTPSTCTVSGTSLTLVAPGICTIAANQPGNATFAPAAPVTRSFQIVPAAVSRTAQTITFAAPGDQTVGAAPLVLSATSSSGLPVSLWSLTPSVCSLAGSTLTLVSAGTCTLTANQAGNASFAGASQVTREFAVRSEATTACATTSFVSGSCTYNIPGVASGLSSTASTSTPLFSGSATRSCTNGVWSTVGVPTCSAAATSQTITFNALSNQTLGVAPPALSATASSNLVVSFSSLTPSVCTVSGTTLTLVSAGTCSVAASQAGNSTFSAATSVSRTFTIGAASCATSSFVSGSCTYNIPGVASGLSSTASTSTPLFSGSATRSCTSGIWTTVGTPSCVSAPSAQTITFNAPAAQTIGVTPPALSASASSGLAVTFSSSTLAVCTVSGSQVNLVSAGTCTISASQAGDSTFAAASSVTRSFTVNAPPAAAVLSVSTGSIAFGAQINNSASSTRSVTLSNSGNASMTISSIGVTGANAFDFVASGGTCTNGTMLAVSASCVYTLFFQPVALGDKTASISITHNGSGSPFAISLTGTSQSVAASVTQQLITEAINVSAAAKATVQNFVASTYDAFTSMVASFGVRDATPATALAAAPASSVDTSNQKNWSDIATWGGTLPTPGSAIVIPAGTTIVLDTATPSLGAVTINGTLLFARQDVAITATNITVSSTGALLVGAPGNPFTNKAIITLTGARPAFPATPTATNRIIDNTRGITVNGGKLELYGASPSPVWTQINDHAAAGTTSFTLKQNVNWAAGNKIIVGPTDYYGVNPTESFTLASASGSSLSTTTPLSKFRWGKLQYMTDNGLSLTPGTYTPPVTPAPTVLDQRAAVGNLSRNIVIQGANDSDWTNKGFGAHVMIMDRASKVFVDGVEFNRVGQAGAMARYPFHWHMLSYRSLDGAYLGDATGHEIRNSTISESAQRCIVVHGTNGVRVVNNICHDIKGHAFFLEDAVERRNVFEGNLALKMRRPADADLILQHEGEPFTAGSSGFWITNPNNTFRSNVVGDAVGNGYWNAFPTSGVGLSRKVKNPDLAGTQWANLQMNPRNIPHNAGGFNAVFDNNVAYSTGQPGVNSDIMLADGGPNATDTGTTGPEAYKPTFDGRPYDINGTRPPSTTPGTATSRATFSRMTIYKTNGGYGNRITAPDYPEWIMSDVAGIYARGAGDDGAFFRGLFIGRSLNDRVGGANTYPASADPQSFFATYHSTFAMRDSTFAHIGFEEHKEYVERTESGVFKSDDYYTQQLERGTILNANNRLIQAFAGARSYPANLLSVNPTIPGRNDLMENFSLAGAIWDPHGYWGAKGFYWVYDTPFYTSGGGCEPSLFPTASGKNSAGKYNGQSCSGEFYGLIYDGDTDIFDEPTGENNALWPVDVERQDCNPSAYSSSSWGTAARACRQVVGSGWNSWKLGQMRGSSVRQGGNFVMRFPNPTGPVINGTGPKWLPGIKQGTMVNAEGQMVATSIPKVVSLRISNLSRESDSFVLGVSFDGSKTPVGVVGATPDSAKRHRWALPPNANLGLFDANKARVLVAASSLAEVEADTTGTKMWQDRANNLVYVKMKGGFPSDPWYRIVNFTAPFGQDLYKTVGLYIKANDIPNQ